MVLFDRRRASAAALVLVGAAALFLVSCVLARCGGLEAQAANVVLVRSASSPPPGSPANLVNETFTGVGYSDGPWNESSDDPGVVIDPNHTANCFVGTGWSGDCLRLSVPRFRTGNAYRDITPAAASTYHRIRVSIPSNPFTSDGDTSILYAAGVSSGTLTNCNPFCLNLKQDTGALLKFEIVFRNDIGAAVAYDISGALSVPYEGRVEIRWTDNGATDTWDWRIGGISQGTGTGDLNASSVGRVWFGTQAEYGMNVYLDNIGVGDTDWIGDN